MKQIVNPDGEVEFIISSEEKEIIDIAVNHLAVSTGTSLAFDVRGVLDD